jgi:hypothetical protein
VCLELLRARVPWIEVSFRENVSVTTVSPE